MQFPNAFVDAHVHVKGPAGLESVRSAGIAAVRDAGFRRNADAPVFKQLKPGAPIVVSSCWALFKKGGYGSPFGVGATTRTEIRTELARLREAGADIIKVMASGIVSFLHPGTVTPGGFDRDELRFIVDEAGEIGLDVMAHANSEPAITAAAASGVRSIEHGFFMTDAALDLMASNRVFWIPTAGALVRAGQKAKGPKPFISGLLSGHLRMIKRAHELGVPLAIGTDCVVPDASYREAYEAELATLNGPGSNGARCSGSRLKAEHGCWD